MRKWIGSDVGPAGLSVPEGCEEWSARISSATRTSSASPAASRQRGKPALLSCHRLKPSEEEAKKGMSPSKKALPNTSAIEGWLAQAMVPVEPRAEFRRKLRARLVHIQGERWLSPWAAFLLVGGILVGLLSWASVVMRLMVILLAGMQLLGKWRSRQRVIL